MEVYLVSRHRIDTDGKGVVSLVALPGCPLNCKYCLNKELLKTKAKEYDLNDVVAEVLKDYCYFVATGGGVCFGGGEALLHYKDIIAFSDMMYGLDIKIGIETSLNVDEHILPQIDKYVDYYIIDIKTLNSEIYEKYTGKTNDLVWKNLNYFVRNKSQNKCTIRIPKIPGYTNDVDIEMTNKMIKNLGFKNIDNFEYIIKKEKN